MNADKHRYFYVVAPANAGAQCLWRTLAKNNDLRITANANKNITKGLAFFAPFAFAAAEKHI
jgi:hypothetical protein